MKYPPSHASSTYISTFKPQSLSNPRCPSSHKNPTPTRGGCPAGSYSRSLVRWFISYLRDLQPTYIYIYIHSGYYNQGSYFSPRRRFVSSDGLFGCFLSKGGKKLSPFFRELRNVKKIKSLPKFSSTSNLTRDPRNLGL